MPLTLSAFQAIPGTTQPATVGSTANTVTLGLSTTGLPLTSVRVTNVGTAAIWIRPIASGNTVTVGITNSMPLLSNETTILGTGGLPCIGYISNSTFTTTAFFTGGIGSGR